MGKLILIRHGQTAKNVGNSLHGADDPETLNEIGEKQIIEVVNKLQAYSPSKIYSSKERRALRSTEILAKVLEVPMEPVDGMQERNWGIFTGKSWSEVQAVLEPMTLGERYTYIPQNGESWRVFETRLIKAIKKITNDNLDKTVVVVTHGGGN